MSIARVWIEPGCIRCSACAYSAPDVFRVPSNSDAVIQGCARVDGIDSTNLTERAALMPACARAHARFSAVDRGFRSRSDRRPFDPGKAETLRREKGAAAHRGGPWAPRCDRSLK